MPSYSKDQEELLPPENGARVTTIARMLAVAYLLGERDQHMMPHTIDEMMVLGHDGLNWQVFMPLAMDIFTNTVIK